MIGSRAWDSVADPQLRPAPLMNMTEGTALIATVSASIEGHRVTAIRTPRDRFVDDSALEGAGFELLVPPWFLSRVEPANRTYQARSAAAERRRGRSQLVKTHVVEAEIRR